MSQVTLEAGEVIVRINDAVTPSRLHKLADDGWSITGASAADGFFKLNLVRYPRARLHKGGPRCPAYCNCLIETGHESEYTV